MFVSRFNWLPVASYGASACQGAAEPDWELIKVWGPPKVGIQNSTIHIN